MVTICKTWVTLNWEQRTASKPQQHEGSSNIMSRNHFCRSIQILIHLYLYCSLQYSSMLSNGIYTWKEFDYKSKCSVATSTLIRKIQKGVLVL